MFHYRIKIAPRQRPDYEGEWVEVTTARIAPANFSNATKFFIPFYPPSQFMVAIEEVKKETKK
jgi:hypothetical protein